MRRGLKLTGPIGATGNGYGLGVALSGDGNTALIGARYTHQADSGSPRDGKAYVFTRTGGTWSTTPTATFDPHPGNGEDLGFGLALDATGATENTTARPGLEALTTPVRFTASHQAGP